ncbi:hypothetical protein BJL95_19675 [Methylomonas sp. LWB]|nr:hypothetical protein BJL95_19675 [Methylomonas sp. LWB]
MRRKFEESLPIIVSGQRFGISSRFALQANIRGCGFGASVGRAEIFAWLRAKQPGRRRLTQWASDGPDGF